MSQCTSDHQFNGPVLTFIPLGVPHLPANLSDAPVTAIIARTDPNEQESVVKLPHLDALVP
jgi:uncharacterized RmlC-like cupin family protein